MSSIVVPSVAACTFRLKTLPFVALQTGDMKSGLGLSTDLFMGNQTWLESFFWIPFLHLHKPVAYHDNNFLRTCCRCFVRFASAMLR